MKKSFLALVLVVILLTACNLPQAGASLMQNQATEAVAPLLDEMEPSVENEVAVTEVEPAPLVANTETGTPVLLFSIGMHVEPYGESMQGFVANNKGDYNEPAFFKLHSGYINNVAEIVTSHDGVMTIQVQSPFTEVVAQSNSTLLKDLAAMGFEIALHFHEDAHLGKKSASLSVEKWCEVMRDEITMIKIASGVDEVNYWSGGNLYPRIYQAAACAGLSVHSDWKSPETQTTDMSLLGINPWRPSGGTEGDDFIRISTHDPMGKVTFLPEGQFDRENIMAIKQSEAAGGDEAYFAYLEQSLMNSLAAASADKVNVFHFTVHPAEFRGDPTAPFAIIDRFLTEVIDPLVASGEVQWATFSQMAEAYQAWELQNPGVDPRN